MFASDVVRYVGEPVAAVAADHPETARRACAAIVVDYEVLDTARRPGAGDRRRRRSTPTATSSASCGSRNGDRHVSGTVVVEGTYEVGMQDQAFMGPEAGLAMPARRRWRRAARATQWLHDDRDQIAECLGLPPDKVRLTLGGVGGAFGAREDISLQIHACLLALHTGRPVKIVYSREESFLGHVHRHPARIWMRHTAEPDGTLVERRGADRARRRRVPVVELPRHRQRGVLRGRPVPGAERASSTARRCAPTTRRAARCAASARSRCASPTRPRWTGWPTPAASTRVELRLRNALATGDTLITGQVIDGALPVARGDPRAAALPLPAAADAIDDVLRLPGRRRPHRRRGRRPPRHRLRGRLQEPDVLRGLRRLLDAARCRLERRRWSTFTCAAAEVGQGFVTLAQQIARDGARRRRRAASRRPTRRSARPARPRPAARRWMSGGAVEQACRGRARPAARARRRQRTACPASSIVDGEVASATGGATCRRRGDADRRSRRPSEYHHRVTHPLDADGQGDAHVAFAFAAHRAVVDVDPELGLVRVVQIATAQDVGRVLNPLQVIGQVEGGIAQGVGLAVMEELRRRRRAGCATRASPTT